MPLTLGYCRSLLSKSIADAWIRNFQYDAWGTYHLAPSLPLLLRQFQIDMVGIFQGVCETNSQFPTSFVHKLSGSEIFASAGTSWFWVCSKQEENSASNTSGWYQWFSFCSTSLFWVVSKNFCEISLFPYNISAATTWSPWCKSGRSMRIASLATFTASIQFHKAGIYEVDNSDS